MRDTKLTRDYLRDLASDIRCARRDAMPDYAGKCVNEFRALWANRHGARIGKYGVPYVEVRTETAYGRESNLSFAIRVF
jgi:hypothetical protein